MLRPAGIGTAPAVETFCQVMSLYVTSSHPVKSVGCKHLQITPENGAHLSCQSSSLSIRAVQGVSVGLSLQDTASKVTSKS